MVEADPRTAGRTAWRGIGLGVLILLTLAGYAPVVSLIAAGAAASWLGCPLDEGSSHPCVAAGIDWGGTLYTAAVLGWLMLLTWPAMLVSLGLWAWLIIRRLRAPTIAPATLHRPL